FRCRGCRSLAPPFRCLVLTAVAVTIPTLVAAALIAMATAIPVACRARLTMFSFSRLGLFPPRTACAAEQEAPQLHEDADLFGCRRGWRRWWFHCDAGRCR